MSIVVNKTRLPVTNWQTKSGAIVSIDDARQRNARSLKVNMLPQQDLHGYDNPWPAGGGKNLFNILWAKPYNENVTLTFGSDGSLTCKNENAYSVNPFGSANSGLLELVNGETYTISSPSFPDRAISLYGSDDGTNWSWMANGLSTTAKSRQFTNTKKYVRLNWNVQANETANCPPIMIELGSTATSYSPYSNLCPISGRSEVRVTRTGKNEFLNATIEQGTITGSGYTQASAYRVRVADFVLLKKGTYKILTTPVLYGTIRVYSTDSANSYISGESITSWTLLNDYEFTLANDRYVKLVLTKDSSNNVPISPSDVKITSASTVSTTYQVTFPALSANQWDEETKLGYYVPTTGAFVSVNNELCSKNYIPILPNTQYRGVGFDGTAFVIFFDSNKNFLSYSRPAGVWTSPNNAYYCLFNLGGNYGSTYNNDVGINYPSTQTTYVPYTNTVYGGTLDLVSGELAVDMITQNITDFTGVFGSTPNGYSVYKAFGSYLRSNRLLCNQFVYSSAGYTTMPLYSFGGSSSGSGTFIFILPSSVTSKNEANAWLSDHLPLTITVELTEPLIFQLTPQQIQTLQGDNTIWADAGNVELTYAARRT